MKKLERANKLHQTFDNERGTAMILLMIVVFLMTAITGGMYVDLSTRMFDVQRFRNESAAFWAAEAGINQYIANVNNINMTGWQEAINSGLVTLDDTNQKPWAKYIISTGTVKGAVKKLQIEFPYAVPGQFSNTITTGGNLLGARLETDQDTVNTAVWSTPVDGGTNLYANNKSQIAGTFQPLVQDQWGQSNGWNSSVIDNLQQNVNNTKLLYPDMDHNGTADEFTDFVQFNRELLQDRYNLDDTQTVSLPGNVGTISYNQEVVHIKLNSNVNNYTLGPSTLNSVAPDLFRNKKILYIEGVDSNNVNNAVAETGGIKIDGSLTDDPNQNITVISTGKITMLKNAMSDTGNKQLNALGWGKSTTVSRSSPKFAASETYNRSYLVGYEEVGHYNYSTSNNYTSRGVIYAHDDVKIFDISDSSGLRHRYHQGLVIANGDYLQADWSARRTYFYDNTYVVNNAVPAGFEGLKSQMVGDKPYQDTPSNWQQIH